MAEPDYACRGQGCLLTTPLLFFGTARGCLTALAGYVQRLAENRLTSAKGRRYAPAAQLAPWYRHEVVEMGNPG